MVFKRVGFACKYMDLNQNQSKKILKEIQQHYSEKTTTMKWLESQSKHEAEKKLWEIITHNTRSVYNLIEYVGHLIPEQRMVRIGSDQLPGFTHPNLQYFWQQTDVLTFLEQQFRIAGDLARTLDVRLSMHPGQFVVLASASPDIVERSIAEFEYHANLIRWMGYGKTFQDFKCNVHISGKQGPEGIKLILGRLSPEARNTITIENDEMSWGIDASLELEKDLALVLDIHHHWIKTGEYIQVTDDKVRRVMDSWRGVRPVIHYSVSPEHVLDHHAVDVRPDLNQLLAQGYNKSQLRQHSDLMWNRACNDWAGTFRDQFDIMVEAKYKNLASIPFEAATRHLMRSL
ncbi:MAG: UV damage endonuclease UvsE [Legionella sp.]|nr:MAG: UV damage endonuclease UvsE [Legionella sp.]